MNSDSINQKTIRKEDLDAIISSLDKKASYLRSISVIIGLVFVLIGAGLLFRLRNQVKQAESQNIQIRKELQIVKQTDKSAALIAAGGISLAQRDSVMRLGQRFFLAMEQRDSEALKSLYADQLERFFLLKNISKSKAYYRGRSYFLTSEGKRFVLNSGVPFQISRVSNYYLLLAQGQNCSKESDCVDTVVELRFDKNHKLFFVRGYYASKMPGIDG